MLISGAVLGVGVVPTVWLADQRFGKVCGAGHPRPLAILGGSLFLAALGTTAVGAVSDADPEVLGGLSAGLGGASAALTVAQFEVDVRRVRRSNLAVQLLVDAPGRSMAPGLGVTGTW